jgi:demethylmenaquinone methyltransferase/2-methoxy-6-polyprenyl-1,4-benzoquinol methylase
MVLDASQRLHAILLGIPDAVAAAKRRAYRQRFNNSCEDAVGRLLSVLAAAVPKAGRILEIGTGVGVGTAWIRYGLNERIDVEVSSVEVDRVLSDAALEWPWPAYMHIVTVDVSLLLGTNATYDLIVADPSPIKHGDLESTIRAIRPGGILIVHDLNTEIVNSETQIARSSELRQLLLHHPKLQSVELDWASGVIVATRTFEIF